MSTRSWICGVTFAAMTAQSSVAVADSKIRVVATFSVLGDMAERVGGDRIAVTALVGPEQDAHVFQPTPAAAASLSAARVVISNGLGFEGWIDRLISSSGYKGAVVVATQGVPSLTSDAEGNKDGHDDHETDPHAWQDLSNALIFVENIKTGLCAVDALSCETYTRNARTFAAEISTLNTEIKKQIDALPADKRKVITSHDAFGYFAKAYGVEFIAPNGLSTDAEASAKDVARIIRQIRQEKVTALFVENISDTRLMDQIANETGVKSGAVLYSDALSKADGPAATYLDMMRHNARQLTQAMAGS